MDGLAADTGRDHRGKRSLLSWCSVCRDGSRYFCVVLRDSWPSMPLA